jgi:hypothetical protein
MPSLSHDIDICQYRRAPKSLIVISPADTAACCSPPVTGLAGAFDSLVERVGYGLVCLFRSVLVATRVLARDHDVAITVRA